MDATTKISLIRETKSLLDGDDWPAVERIWAPYADAGDAEARAQLAYFYLFYGFNEGEQKDREMRTLLVGAAESGHADAAYCLAVRQQHSVERDEWLKRAGELGNRDAQRDLGALYATGDWTGPKDPVQGVYWYTLAAERGHDDAQYNLGCMFIWGEGTESNVAEGIRWLQLSAEQGNTEAMRLLAELYRHGHCGVKIDADAANHWEEQLQGTEQVRRRVDASKKGER